MERQTNDGHQRTALLTERRTLKVRRAALVILKGRRTVGGSRRTARPKERQTGEERLKAVALLKVGEIEKRRTAVAAETARVHQKSRLPYFATLPNVSLPYSLGPSLVVPSSALRTANCHVLQPTQWAGCE